MFRKLTFALLALIFAVSACGLMNTPTPTPVFTPPTKVSTPPTMIPHPYPPELAQKGAKMVLIPAGMFTMGSNKGEDDEKPPHAVSLDAFYIDKYEVTNALYKMCVEADTCQPPKEIRSYTRSSYYGNSQFDNYPVINVDWHQSKTYCEWRGARLPSEAEWEYAARGTDERTYPWGEGIDETHANYNQSDTTAVGSYESGKSPFGVYDMAGNVWEWVNDWYSETYYQSSPPSNPLGPASGQHGILRGGAWNVFGVISRLRSANRITVGHSSWDDLDGFRCALSP